MLSQQIHRALDESADEQIIAAVKNRELGDWESIEILEHRPYSEAYDIAIERWQDESDNDIDSYEIFAQGLQGIGDPRGIKKLQDIYANENDATYIGNALECLAVLHDVDLPEFSMIRRKRQEREERQKSQTEGIRRTRVSLQQKESQRCLWVWRTNIAVQKRRAQSRQE